MSHEVETMAYRKESEADVPWHGLGNSIDHDLTPDQMLVVADLDWTVSKRPLVTTAGYLTDSFSKTFEMHNMVDVPDLFALVRDSDNKVLGPCGKEYVPTQNAKAFDFFKKFTDAGQMRMETAGSLMGGKQVWVLAKMLSSLKLPGDDEIRGYLLLSHPHVWGKSLVMKFVTIRVVCNNTYTMAMRSAGIGSSFRMTHTREFDDQVAEEAAKTLGLAEDMFLNFGEKATKMTEAAVEQPVIVNYIASVYQPALIAEVFGTSFYNPGMTPKRQAELLCDPKSPVVDPVKFNANAMRTLKAYDSAPGSKLISSKGTMWGAFNAVSYFIDHVAGRNRDNALQSSWFGLKSVEKTKAFDKALHISEVVLG